MRRLFFFLLLAVVGACVPSVIRRRPAPSVPAATPTTPAFNTAGPWVLSAPAVSQKVTIDTRAVVTIKGDTTTRVDTLQAMLGASFVWASRAHRKVDGILTDYRVAVGSTAPSAPAGMQLPKPYTAEKQASGVLAFKLPAESAACTDPTLSALQGLHEAWFALPDTLVVGREWSDTVHTLSCRDRIPLRGTAVRRFRVRRGEVENGARVVVMIERTLKAKISGAGDMFGEPVALDGESSGTLLYAIDPSLGRPLRATGTSTLSLSLKSKRRNQAVRQESVLTLSWVP